MVCFLLLILAVKSAIFDQSGIPFGVSGAHTVASRPVSTRDGLPVFRFAWNISRPTFLNKNFFFVL